jgi:hypothetical protein
MVEMNRRFDLAKLLDQGVSFFSWRQLFYIFSGPAGVIGQAFLKCRGLLDMAALHHGPIWAD